VRFANRFSAGRVSARREAAALCRVTLMRRLKSAAVRQPNQALSIANGSDRLSKNWDRGIVLLIGNVRGFEIRILKLYPLGGGLSLISHPCVLSELALEDIVRGEAEDCDDRRLEKTTAPSRSRGESRETGVGHHNVISLRRIREVNVPSKPGQRWEALARLRATWMSPLRIIKRPPWYEAAFNWPRAVEGIEV
jgi:hypothetical protein